MKIISEKPDLKRVFTIEMTLGELKTLNEMLDDHWCRYNIFPEHTEQYKFYKEIKKILTK